MCNVCEATRTLAAGDEGERYGWRGAGTVHVRAKGEPEGHARFQIRRKGEDWPMSWKRTDDLAGVMADYGLDVQWHAVHPTMQAYVRGEREALPTVRDLDWTDVHRASLKRPARVAAA